MEGGETQHNLELPDCWEYQKYTREYLLLLANKGKEGLESITNFPKKLEIGPEWHQTLNEMGDQTSDGIERWGFIGFRRDMRTLVLPSVFGKGVRGNLFRGTVNHIPYSVRERGIQNAKTHLGIEGLVGDIHTHPTGRIEKFAKGFLGSIFFYYTGPGFSPGDLYWLVHPKEFYPLKVLVHDGNNYMAFKTRETDNVPLDPGIVSQESFEKYWYEKFGSFRLKGVGGVTLDTKPASNIDINKGISQKHKLVLYGGSKNSILERIYP